MKVAILTDGIYPYVIGGMQKHSYYLVKFLVQKGVDVTLYHCVPYGEKLILNHQVKQDLGLQKYDSFNSVCLHFPKPGFLPGHYIKESYLLSKLIYKQIEKTMNDFDLIYSKGFMAWEILHQKGNNSRKFPPVCVKFHGYEMFQKTASFKEKLKQYLLKGSVKYNNIKADYVFSYGGKITDIIKKLGVNNEKIIDIPTGIERKWIKANALTIPPIRKYLFIGRYERRKGIEELNKALAAILKENTPFEFHFVGPIPVDKQLENKHILYHGKIIDVDKMQTIIDGCEVLICPSYSEGMPNVIMEAMARGLAVIATDVGAVNQVVESDNGWLIEPANDQELINAITESLKISANELLKKRRYSLTKIANFTWEKVADDTIKEFKAILTKK